MEKSKKHKITEETDKFRKDEGRKAAAQEKDSEFLNEEALEDDLVEVKTNSPDDSRIVDSDHPENQEWNAREAQNKDSHP